MRERMQINIVPFVPEHLLAIAPGPFDAAAAEGLDLRALAVARADIGPAWSAVASGGKGRGEVLGCAGIVPLWRGEVLGCAGIVPLWRGVGAGWLFGGEELRRHPLALHRAVARGIPCAMRGLGLHRLQISVHENFAKSLDWADRLGFVREGRMPGYGPNGDSYIRYARTTHVRN